MIASYACILSPWSDILFHRPPFFGNTRSIAGVPRYHSSCINTLFLVLHFYKFFFTWTYFIYRWMRLVAHGWLVGSRAENGVSTLPGFERSPSRDLPLLYMTVIFTFVLFIFMTAFSARSILWEIRHRKVYWISHTIHSHYLQLPPSQTSFYFS